MTRPSLTSFRYLVVGAVCAGLNNAILIAGAALGLHYALSLAASFAVVVVVGYIGHAKITFAQPWRPEAFGRYAAAMLVNLPLCFFLLAAGDALRLPMIISAPVTTVTMLACNYVSSRWAIAARSPGVRREGEPA